MMDELGVVGVTVRAAPADESYEDVRAAIADGVDVRQHFLGFEILVTASQGLCHGCRL
jgi:hypothetical protein